MDKTHLLDHFRVNGITRAPWALCNAISAAIVGIGFLIPALNEFREPSMIQIYLDMIREF